MELIRVNRKDGEAPVIVPRDRLQNKGDRYYFRDSTRLARDQIYISPFDLNVENGTVEVPFNPMLRFAAPVLDEEDQTRGWWSSTTGVPLLLTTWNAPPLPPMAD